MMAMPLQSISKRIFLFVVLGLFLPRLPVAQAFSAIAPQPSSRAVAAPAPTAATTSHPFYDYPPRPDHARCSELEWQQRCQLAVSYRIACLEDWHMNIFNHITLRIQGSDKEADGPHFLLNDYGMGFDEITASNLLKVTLEGNQVPPPLEEYNGNHQPKKKGRVFKAGYVLHSALHKSRHDAHAVWHCHDLDTTALCQTSTGLLPLSQEATFALHKGVA